MLEKPRGSFAANFGARIEVVRRRRAFEAELEVGVDGTFRAEPEAQILVEASLEAYGEDV